MTTLPTNLALGSLGALGAGSAALWASLSPTNNFWGRVHSRATSTTSTYALTFDDGPTPNSTPAILDTLAELNVQATFFVIGKNARRHPNLITRIHEEGHIVANHSLDHPHMGLFRGQRYWNRQLLQTDNIIQQIIREKPAMFRPPIGIKTFYVMHAAARQNLAVITWSRRAVDGIQTTPERILNRLVPHTCPGDILLLHDGVEPGSRRNPAPTVAAVKPLILQLRDRGLEPAPLSELLLLPPYAPAQIAKRVA